MFTAIKPLSIAPDEHDSGPVLRSLAVERCQKSWNHTYNSSLKRQKSVAVARLDASDAYRLAMPQLVGRENIRNFITCVAYAMVNGIFIEEAAKSFLFAARIALNALPVPPKTNQTKLKTSRNDPAVTGSLDQSNPTLTTSFDQSSPALTASLDQSSPALTTSLDEHNLA
jgi:hypothetical protein